MLLENDNIEFHGEVFKSNLSSHKSYVSINGKSYDILPKTVEKYKLCTNAREYVESVEYFAYEVLVKKSIINDGYFRSKEDGD